MKRQFFLILLVALASTYTTKAQQQFVEGILTYSFLVKANNPDAAKQEARGSFIIKLKGNSVLKEMTMENGFNNTILYLAPKSAYYSFRKTNNQSFAIQLNTAQMEQKRGNCSKLSLLPLPGDIKAIKNFKTEKARLTCNNAKQIDISYTKEWGIKNEHLFDEFPSFEFLPLSFEIINADGSIFSFLLENIEVKPLDNSSFDIPNGYKIISQEEYKSWHH